MASISLVADAIKTLRPGAAYTLRGTSASYTLDWTDDTQTEPTSSEIEGAFDDAKWDRVRIERDGRLAASDWSSVSDNQLSDTERAAWETYRQTLRDIPQTQSDPDNVTWPTPPTT
jgi:hypothetical protein